MTEEEHERDEGRDLLQRAVLLVLALGGAFLAIFALFLAEHPSLPFGVFGAAFALLFLWLSVFAPEQLRRQVFRVVLGGPLW